MIDGDFLADINPDGTISLLERLPDEGYDYCSQENISKFLMNSLNALFHTEIEFKNYDFLQYLSSVFDMTQYTTPMKYDSINRTHTETLNDSILFEIARCYTNAIIQNPSKGYNALNTIYSSKFPLFKDADKMTDGELYNALEQTASKKFPGYSLYGVVCCCLFLSPNANDERWKKFIDQQNYFYHKYSHRNDKKWIEMYWNIDDLYEDKTFQRFVKKRRYNLATYLKCNEDNIQHYLIRIMPWNEAKNANRNPSLLQSDTYKFMKMIFLHLTDTWEQNFISFNWIFEYSDKYYGNVMNKCLLNSFNKLILKKIAEMKNNNTTFPLENLIDGLLISDPKTFLEETIINFYISLSSILINDSMQYSFENFSLERITHQDANSLLRAQLTDYTNMLNSKDLRLESLTNEVEALKTRNHALENDLYKESSAVISDYEKKLELSDKENLRLKEKLAAYEEYFALLSNDNELLVSPGEELDITEVIGKRMLFIGGRIELIQKLKYSFPSSVFVQDEITKIDFSNFERVIMFPKFMNHSLFYKYINLARANKVDVTYCNSNNIEQVLNTIVASFK